MPTVTWARVDPARRAAIIEAAEAEFGAHGFSSGSLNVIARRAGVAKGSLFQYFADKRDLYAFIADIGSQRVRAYMEDCIRELDPSRPFFEFLTDWLDVWVGYFADHPHERALHAAASLEVDTDARISVRSVIHRHYLEVLRPLVRDAQVRGDFRHDADIDALMTRTSPMAFSRMSSTSLAVCGWHRYMNASMRKTSCFRAALITADASV